MTLIPSTLQTASYDANYSTTITMCLNNNIVLVIVGGYIGTWACFLYLLMLPSNAAGWAMGGGVAST